MTAIRAAMFRVANGVRTTRPEPYRSAPDRDRRGYRGSAPNLRIPV